MKDCFLLLHKDGESSESVDMGVKRLPITDDGYLDFIKVANGGSFFKKALLLYTFSNEDLYPSIFLVNQKIALLYGELFNNLISFGQDIFGNQFCFDVKNKTIVMFNIEDADKTFMATSFKEWMNVLSEDYDYFTGFSYAKMWQASNILKIDQRLCPKIPFVIGGDFKVENFYASTFPAFLELNADIAKQIHNLPDGASVTYKIRT